MASPLTPEEEPEDNESEPEDIKDMLNITAQVGEMYSNYLIMARSKNGNFVYRSSDSTWAIGACHKYLAYQDARNRAEELESS